MIKQGTSEWHLQRHGKFTSSRLGDLLVTGKGYDFGKTAMCYIREIAAERDINTAFLSLENDENTGQCPFDLYLARMKRSSKAMQWGTESEELARKMFFNATGHNIEEVGFIEYNEYFGDSADGIICFNNGQKWGVVEIKAPDPATHILYRQIKNNEDLKEINNNYFAQIQGHMLAHNVKYGYFISLDIMSKKPLHYVRIERDDTFITYILKRLQKANEIVNQLIIN